MENVPRIGGDIHEAVAGIAREEHWLAVMQVRILLLNRVEIVPLRDEKVLPAVVVVIEEANAPPGMQHGDAAETAGEAGVRKAAVAGVLINRVALIGKIRDDKIGQTVVVVIGEVHAHAGERAAVAIDSDTGEEANFFERAVALVVIQKLDHGIVGNENVDVAVAVVIGESDAKPLAGLREAALLRQFGEMTVAVIVIHERRDGLEDVGVAIGAMALLVFAAPDVVEIPLHVTQNNQIQQAVAVQIHPGGAGGPSAAGDASLLRYVSERAVAVVVVKLVATVGGYEEVLEAVIVVVTYGDAHSIACALQAGALRHIFEGAVGFLVEEAIPVLRARFLGNGTFW